MRDAMGSRRTEPPRGSAILTCLLVIAGLLVGCSGPTSATPTATVAQAAVPTTTAAPGGTASPTATPTATVTSSPASAPASPTAVSGTPASTAAAGPSPTGQAAPYLDDRSGPRELIESYYNAINLEQFARAYGYWETGLPASQLPPFAQFEQGYTDTGRVDLTLGQITGGAAAGNLYYSVPVVLNAHMTGGGTQTFAGCYTLHLGQPANQAVPPFRPMAIQSAAIKQAAPGATTSGLLAGACPDQGQPLPATPAPAPGDISAARYLDDRSTGEEVVRSYYNAINRKEYARAYGYWEPGAAAAQLKPFDQFQQGYAQTASVTLTTGAVAGDVGAGQLYYTVPVAIAAVNTDGSRLFFVGCYRLHLAQPLIQAVPPFQPLAIQSASLRQVPTGARVELPSAQSCAP